MGAGGGSGLPPAGTCAPVAVLVAALDLRSLALPATVKAVLKSSVFVDPGDALMPAGMAGAAARFVCGGLANTGMFS